MHYTVYILFSEKDKNLYVGCTSDLTKRLKKHFSGAVKATFYRRPLTLIHTEHFSDKGEAFNRERFLKSLWGARTKKKIKEDYLKNKNVRSFA